MDTIQGVLKYKRLGSDSRVSWAPPSALRKIDVLLCDEASQYEDLDWERFFVSVKEQPHKPYCAVVAEPVSNGGMCEHHCKQMGDQVTLKTVYRTSDEEHLLFLNRIRVQQPDRPCLEEYFGDRHWHSSGPYQQMTLQECVAKGMELGSEQNEVFTWLTATNRGAAEVCTAALLNKGITKADTDLGYHCDPTSKSTIGILAIAGIILRLTRNLDKGRGFVNGALCIVIEKLHGNGYFIAPLASSLAATGMLPQYDVLKVSRCP